MFSSSRLFAILALVVLAIGIAGYLWFVTYSDADRNRSAPETIFQETVIVPTLDTPIPAGKSAIWCASFQLAWNRLKNDVVKEPIRLQNAQEVADRLNKAEQSEKDLERGSYYAAAGLTSDDIVEKIVEEMHERFPGVEVPEFGRASEDIVAIAFAYLNAEMQFRHRYEKEAEGMKFRGEDGKEPRVRAFGVRKQDRHKRELRDQISVLFAEMSKGRFAVDLDYRSRPHQLILAALPRQESLAESLRDLAKQSVDAKKFGARGLGPLDTLLAPDMTWKTSHHFAELEGSDKPFENRGHVGNFLHQAVQVIDFRLDHTGAKIESHAKVSEKKSVQRKEEMQPREYHFDRPFLLVMKKRDAEHPFLVVWVANAELLQKLGGGE